MLVAFMFTIGLAPRGHNEATASTVIHHLIILAMKWRSMMLVPSWLWAFHIVMLSDRILAERVCMNGPVLLGCSWVATSTGSAAMTTKGLMWPFAPMGTLSLPRHLLPVTVAQRMESQECIHIFFLHRLFPRQYPRQYPQQQFPPQ